MALVRLGRAWWKWAPLQQSIMFIRPVLTLGWARAQRVREGTDSRIRQTAERRGKGCVNLTWLLCCTL